MSRINQILANLHPDGAFFVFSEALSDGTTAWNVGMTEYNGRLVITAVSRQAAYEIAYTLNNKTSYVEFTPTHNL